MTRLNIAIGIAMETISIKAYANRSVQTLLRSSGLNKSMGDPIWQAKADSLSVGPRIPSEE